MQNSSTDGDPAADGEGLARQLFVGLRDLDEAGAAVIVCPLRRSVGFGEAIRDRLRKAARKQLRTIHGEVSEAL